MPELPEVQTIVNDLNQELIGYKILDFQTSWQKGLKFYQTDFEQKIKNQIIQGARRFGKHIILDLNNSYSLVIHLKMTGHLLLKKDPDNFYFKDRVNQYIRHTFLLEDKNKEKINLDFSDLRKFGWIDLVLNNEVEKLKSIQILGIDALSKKLNFPIFNQLLNKKPKSLIAIFLLDQSIISGIGNIYRSEILFESQINPQAKIKDLDLAQRKKIYSAIRSILNKAIELRGTSDSDFRDLSGVPGGFQDKLKVYRRHNQVCLICQKTIIQRIKISQRSVFFCSLCQK